MKPVSIENDVKPHANSPRGPKADGVDGFLRGSAFRCDCGRLFCLMSEFRKFALKTALQAINLSEGLHSSLSVS